MPELQNIGTREQLEAASSFLQAHPVVAPQLIGAQVNTTSGLRSVNLSWEYRAGSQWVRTNVAAQHSATRSPRIFGFNVHPLDASLRELNRFTFRDRSPIHVLWLIVAVIAPLLCIARVARGGAPGRSSA